MYLAGPSFAAVVHRNGTDQQKHWAQLMIDRGWGATMVLTEPDAGSDVGAGRTKAVRQEDGTWHIDGVKRFITSAEQDMTENIMHLVLARPEGAGRPHDQAQPTPRRRAGALFVVVASGHSFASSLKARPTFPRDGIRETSYSEAAPA